jgi:hypothetical protein
VLVVLLLAHHIGGIAINILGRLFFFSHTDGLLIREMNVPLSERKRWTTA